jgi:RNA recognition motif-containing protein
MTSEDPKTDPTTEKVEQKEDNKEEAKNDDEVIKSVAERLRFFFSDANVRQDLFLRKFLMVKEGALVGNKDLSPGAVPIESLLRFNTIKQHTTDPKVVVKAVTTLLSDKLLIKDEEKSIARVKPFTEELMDENIPLTLYVKNLPTKEVDNHGKKQLHYDVQMEDVRKLFESYGEVAIVKLRFKRSAHSDDDHHTDDIKAAQESGGKKPIRRYPMGDCLVEFEDKDSLEKAAADVVTLKGGEAVEANRKLHIGDSKLEVMTLRDYMDGLKKRKREKESDKDGDVAKAVDNENASEFTVEWKQGCVVSLKGLPESCDREAILDAVTAACDLTKEAVKEKKIYADYSRGQKDGAVRFPEADLSKVFAEKVKSGDVKIGDTKVEEATVLEGDEEKKYWDNFIQFRKQQIKHRNDEKKGRKRRKTGRRSK